MVLSALAGSKGQGLGFTQVGRHQKWAIGGVQQGDGTGCTGWQEEC